MLAFLDKPAYWVKPLKMLMGMSEKTVSLRGLKCPLPALRTRKLLRGLSAGEVVVVECTDPLAAIDIPNLIRQTGDVLEHSERDGDVLVFRIRKA
jgi:tRNA 2-thiouridine synthesizing protein A